MCHIFHHHHPLTTSIYIPEFFGHLRIHQTETRRTLGRLPHHPAIHHEGTRRCCALWCCAAPNTCGAAQLGSLLLKEKQQKEGGLQGEKESKNMCQ